MSSARVRKTALQRIGFAIALFIVFAILMLVSRSVPHFAGGVATLGAVGFLLLAGTLFSELGEILGLPHLTGYLLAGIFAGPYVLHLIDHETVAGLSMVDRLALSLIALAGGAELKLDLLSRGIKSLTLALFIQCVGGLLIMACVFTATSRLMPFTKALTLTQVFGVGLLWGLVAITRSPSACLGILSQTRATGPIARFSLTFVMSSDIVVVVMLSIVMTIARPLVLPDEALSLGSLRTLGRDVIGSIAIGTTLGLALGAYLHFFGRQLLVVFVALGYGLNQAINYLHFEPLLSFLIAGFVVQNFSKHGGRFLEAIEQTGGVVYIIFFASAGAHLNVDLLRTLWPVALILCGSRLVVTYGAARLASHLAGDAQVVKTWGFSGMISQAGVALGISALIANAFPTFGAGFGALGLAAVAINEMVGPVIFKLALDKNGESKTEDAVPEAAHEAA